MHRERLPSLRENLLCRSTPIINVPLKPSLKMDPTHHLGRCLSERPLVSYRVRTFVCRWNAPIPNYTSDNADLVRDQ